MMKIVGGLALQIGSPGLTDSLSAESAQEIAGAVYAVMVRDRLVGVAKGRVKAARRSAKGRSSHQPEASRIDHGR
jgi:hypothetical protein